MRAITDSLKANFDRGWGLLDQIIEVCPEAVWSKKAGGFLFWQQIYHCFGCVDYFIGPKDGTLDAGPLGMDTVMFKACPEATPSKAEVKAYGDQMRAKADTWIAALDDAALAQTHEGFSARRGAPMTNGMVFSIMSGHSMYHVGGCDVILRDNGEKGVM